MNAIILNEKEVEALRDALTRYYESNSAGRELAAVVDFILRTKGEA